MAYMAEIPLILQGAAQRENVIPMTPQQVQTLTRESVPGAPVISTGVRVPQLLVYAVIALVVYSALSAGSPRRSTY